MLKIKPAQINKNLRKASLKLLVLLLIVGLNGVMLSRIGYTVSYYSDKESSHENLFSAAMLDLLLSKTSFESQIGTEALGEKSLATVAMPVEGSLDMQYIMHATSSTPSALCDELFVEAKLNGITKYSGNLLPLAYSTSTDFGTWEFRFDLPPLAAVGHGETCSVGAEFLAWRLDTPEPSNSGYDDEELLALSFTARMIVLNEIYANPSGGDAPLDHEYIEIFNNGNTDVDILGWKISELSGGGIENFYEVVASGASSGEVQPYDGASTLVSPGSSVVLEFGGAASLLNNSGDTVSLYDTANILQDSHAYTATAPGKSHVRFPDGIGFWVDPDPTPGEKNSVSVQELAKAGFSDEEIEEMMRLAELVNAPALTDKPEDIEIPEVVVVEDEESEEGVESGEVVVEEDTSTTTEEIIQSDESSEPEDVSTSTDIDAIEVEEVEKSVEDLEVKEGETYEEDLEDVIEPEDIEIKEEEEIKEAVVETEDVKLKKEDEGEEVKEDGDIEEEEDA